MKIVLSWGQKESGTRPFRYCCCPVRCGRPHTPRRQQGSETRTEQAGAAAAEGAQEPGHLPSSPAPTLPESHPQGPAWARFLPQAPGSLRP